MECAKVGTAGMLKNFYVICVISNPVRFKSRYALYLDFAKRMEQAGIKLLTVECAFGDRMHAITDEEHDDWLDLKKNLRLTTFDELWHKENMINIGVSQLPRNWEYMCWIDADIAFLREDWMIETYHALQHHYVVQMFQTAVDLGPQGEAFGLYQGFAWAYKMGKFNPSSYRYTSFHPGYAWAIRREAFDFLGGLIDIAILGSADRNMAYGLVGMMEHSIHPRMGRAYKRAMMQWERRAERHIQRDIGFVPGTIVHYWHGKKVDRQYQDRWRLLIRNRYNPDRDLKKDCQGLYQLEVRTPRQIRLRDDLRAYFRAHHEDSIDVE